MSLKTPFRKIFPAVLMVGAIAGMALMTQSAEAQSCGYGGYGGYSGHGGHGGHGHYGSSIRLNVGYGSLYSGYSSGIHSGLYRSYYRRPAVWHDTSHYDYHPGRYVRHGNHYDYIPGHAHLHRTGHWDH